MMFLQLVAGGHLMLFVTRTRGALWKPPYPNPKLFFAIVATQIAAMFPVQSGLARAVTSLENHRFCLGLQPDLDQFAKLRGQQHV
jgi:H+-transporting ATPase